MSGKRKIKGAAADGGGGKRHHSIDVMSSSPPFPASLLRLPIDIDIMLWILPYLEAPSEDQPGLQMAVEGRSVV
jgi:hypothetical protein